jgi:hypothetical protein
MPPDLVGYSVNDTVVVYDRVRGPSGSRRSRSVVINRSINQTLSRTIPPREPPCWWSCPLLPGGRGPQHLRADPGHRHPHRDVLLDLRRGGHRGHLARLPEPGQARRGAGSRQATGAGPAGLAAAVGGPGFGVQKEEEPAVANPTSLASGYP